MPINVTTASAPSSGFTREPSEGDTTAFSPPRLLSFDPGMTAAPSRSKIAARSRLGT